MPDKAVCIGQLRCRDDLLVRGIQLPVTDIVHNCSGEKMRVLQHDSKRPSQIRLLDLIDVDAVIPNLTILDIIEPIDQIGDGGLPRAGRTYESDLLSGRGKKFHVMQHDLLVVVAEINTVKHHVACQLHIIHGVIRLMLMPPCPTPGTLLALHQPAVVLFHIDKCHITVVRFRLFVHHHEDTLRACHGHHDGIELLTDLIDRAVKALVKSQEAGQRTERQPGDS